MTVNLPKLQMLAEAKVTPPHLMPRAGKGKKVNGMSDFKAGLAAIGGAKKLPSLEGKTYYVKAGKVVGIWDSLDTTGQIFSA